MNGNQTKFLSDVVVQMRSLDSDGKAIPFSIAVRTFQSFSKTGGALNKYPAAKLVMQEKFKNKDSIRSLRTAPRKKVDRKNPHHFQNKTRNIKLPNGQIKKIHINNIIEFNGVKVVY
jgi:hypothetical protein